LVCYSLELVCFKALTKARAAGYKDIHRSL
jgi:hypothetical protein